MKQKYVFLFLFLFHILITVSNAVIMPETFPNEITIFNNISAFKGWDNSNYTQNVKINQTNEWYYCKAYNVNVGYDLNITNRFEVYTNQSGGTRASGICLDLGNETSLNASTKIGYKCGIDNLATKGFYLGFMRDNAKTFDDNIFLIDLISNSSTAGKFKSDIDNECWSLNWTKYYQCDGLYKEFTIQDLIDEGACSINLEKLSENIATLIIGFYGWEEDLNRLYLDDLNISGFSTSETIPENLNPYFTGIDISDTTIIPGSTIDIDYTGYDTDNDQLYFAYSCSDLNDTGFIQDFKEDFEFPYDNADLGIPDYFNDSYNEVLDYDDSKVLNFSDTDVIGLELYADLKSPYSEYRGIISIDFKQLDYWTSFYPQGFMIRLQDILNPVAEIGIYLENNTQYSVWTTGSNGLWFKVLTLYDTGYMDTLNRITVNYDLATQTYNFSNVNLMDGFTVSSNYALKNTPILLKRVSLKTFANLNASSNITLGEPYFTSLGGSFIIDNFLIYKFSGPSYHLGVFDSVNNYNFSHTCYYSTAGIYKLTSYIADYYSKDWSIYNTTLITVSTTNALNQSNVINASYEEVINATDPLKVVKKMVGSSLKEYLETMGLYDTGKPVLWFMFICFFVWLIFTQYDITKQLDFIVPLMISSACCGFVAYLVDYTFQLVSFAILLCLSIALMVSNSMRAT